MPAESPISNSGVTEGENDYDEYFDSGEVEEYIQVKDSEHSCHILPVSNTKYNSGDSQYEDDEVQSVVEEDEDDNETANQAQNGASKEKHELNQDGPEVQNAKLLAKYAEQMSAAEPSTQAMVTHQEPPRLQM